MFGFRFFASWIASSIVMYLAFYAWHGIFLDDFSRLNYSKHLFFIFSAITYLVVGLILFLSFEIKFLEKLIPNSFLRGLLTGACIGLLVFIVTRVTGVGIGQSITFKHLMLDASWQITEQVVGGSVIALCKWLILEPAFEDE
jgi:H+/Cl- antiporter ClcA